MLGSKELKKEWGNPWMKRSFLDRKMRKDSMIAPSKEKRVP